MNRQETDRMSFAFDPIRPHFSSFRPPLGVFYLSSGRSDSDSGNQFFKNGQKNLVQSPELKILPLIRYVAGASRRPQTYQFIGYKRTATK